MAEGFPAVGILAGGESRRFGQDKAWVGIHGEPAIVRLVAALRGQGARELLVSARPPLQRFAALGCAVVEDRLGAGPLAGVHALLEAMAGDWLLVVPVDLVELPADWLPQWWSVWRCAGPACRALVLCDADGAWHPVYAMLHRSLAGQAGAALAARRWGLGDFLRHVDAEPVPVPLPTSFNTPGDLAAAGVQSACDRPSDA